MCKKLTKIIIKFKHCGRIMKTILLSAINKLTNENVCKTCAFGPVELDKHALVMGWRRGENISKSNSEETYLLKRPVDKICLVTEIENCRVETAIDFCPSCGKAFK